MLVKEKIYSKRFSQILNLQDEEEIEYSLIKQNNGKNNLYGIEVQSINPQEERNKVTEYLSENKGNVLSFIKYLYENSVRVDICKDIINDFFNRRPVL